MNETQTTVEHIYLSLFILTLINAFIITKGLGDRHTENVLIDTTNAENINCDFDCLFDKGLSLARPEIVPFRLTPNMVDAMVRYVVLQSTIAVMLVSVYHEALNTNGRKATVMCNYMHIGIFVSPNSRFKIRNFLLRSHGIKKRMIPLNLCDIIMSIGV